MIDLGLTSGIKDLWQENLLRDYTLVVEGQEFQVHKVVLAAVSKYFKAMFAEGFMESKTDKVQVKGFSADIVGKLLDFVYTAEDATIADNTLDILKCAMYLQMPVVAEFCVKKLMENLEVPNCLGILSALIAYSFPKEVTAVKDFMRSNWAAVMKTCNLKTLSSDTVVALMDCMQTSEWDMFMFVQNWICVDYENRISFVDGLMSKVRFCLIAQEDVHTITKMDIYCKTEGPWKDLVVNAVRYHQLPINLKVLDRSEQSKATAKPEPAVFLVNPEENVATILTLDRGNIWATENQCRLLPIKVDGYHESAILEVNNYLIVFRSDGEGQDWQIFDPRTLIWSTMPIMEKQKKDFPIVHHKDILYTVGGTYPPDDTSLHDMDQYSFLTNSWSAVHQLPIALSETAACVLGDTIYVSGGYSCEDHEYEGVGVYCINLSSDTNVWETKASCLWEVYQHQMSVIKRHGEEGLFIFDTDFNMQFYSPSNDQWSEITNTAKPDPFHFEWPDLVLVRGDTLFILNMYLPIVKDDGEVERNHVSWKLTIPEDGGKISKMELQALPQITLHKFGAVLAISPQNVNC